jgi:hypothetical protein
MIVMAILSDQATGLVTAEVHRLGLAMTAVIEVCAIVETAIDEMVTDETVIDETVIDEMVIDEMVIEGTPIGVEEAATVVGMI